MSLFFSDYSSKNRTKTQQAIDYIQEALVVIENREQELALALSGSEKKILPIKDANLMGKVSSIDFYKNKGFVNGETRSGYGYTSYNNDVAKTCEVAKQHADWLLAESAKIHETNLDAIENNKQIEKALRTFMSKIGIGSTFTTYNYVSAYSGRRTQKQQEHTKSSGWVEDSKRCIKTDDGFTMAETAYKQFMQRIDDYHKAEQKKEDEAKLAKAQSEQDERNAKTLATLIIKYKIDYSSSWNDLLNAILSQNKYLELAYWLERQRNSWADGFWKAERGLANFTVETEEDKKISNSLYSILEDAEDGREFRDCFYNYDYLYSLVNNEELYNDFRLVFDKLADQLD